MILATCSFHRLAIAVAFYEFFQFASVFLSQRLRLKCATTMTTGSFSSLQEVEIFSQRKLLSFCYALRESVPRNERLCIGVLKRARIDLVQEISLVNNVTFFERDTHNITV